MNQGEREEEKSFYRSEDLLGFIGKRDLQLGFKEDFLEDMMP